MVVLRCPRSLKGLPEAESANGERYGWGPFGVAAAKVNYCTVFAGLGRAEDSVCQVPRFQTSLRSGVLTWADEERTQTS